MTQPCRNNSMIVLEAHSPRRLPVKTPVFLQVARTLHVSVRRRNMKLNTSGLRSPSDWGSTRHTWESRRGRAKWRRIGISSTKFCREFKTSVGTSLSCHSGIIVYRTDRVPHGLG